MTNMPSNIFISHIDEGDNRVDSLKALLRQSGCDVRHSSVNRAWPDNGAIGLEWASVFVVLISKDSRSIERVTWEIECAQKLGKRIVGVWDRSSAERDIPDALEQYADAIVCWRSERTKAAILGDSIIRETPSCEPAAPRDLPRYSC